VAALAPVKSRIETRAQKLTGALAQCHRDRSKKKRAKCETAAKRKYGSAKKPKKTHGKGRK
jgi:hypothetical protein